MNAGRLLTSRLTLGLLVLVLVGGVLLLARGGTEALTTHLPGGGHLPGSSHLPGSGGSASLRRGGTPPLVFLDPGHGGVDTGAVGTASDGTPVDEKTIALAIAQRTAAKLRAAGYRVVLARDDDTLPGLTPDDLTSDGQRLTAQGVLDDLQRRIDRANASGADLLLSIHLNALDDPSVRGAETYYDSARPFAADSLRFAQLVQDDLIAALRAKGYATPDRGVLDDTTLQADGVGPLGGSYNHLVMLGPAIPGKLRPSQMPGALNESLFLSNPDEASAATQPAMQDLIAGAFAKAVEDYFAGK